MPVTREFVLGNLTHSYAIYGENNMLKEAGFEKTALKMPAAAGEHVGGFFKTLFGGIGSGEAAGLKLRNAIGGLWRNPEGAIDRAGRLGKKFVTTVNDVQNAAKGATSMPKPSNWGKIGLGVGIGVGGMGALGFAANRRYQRSSYYRPR